VLQRQAQEHGVIHLRCVQRATCGFAESAPGRQWQLQDFEGMPHHHNFVKQQCLSDCNSHALTLCRPSGSSQDHLGPVGRYKCAAECLQAALSKAFCCMRRQQLHWDPKPFCCNLCESTADQVLNDPISK
jgi:hypothetical protein